MRFLIWLFTVALFLAETPASAQDGLFNRNDMFDAISAGDYAKAQDGVHDLQKRFRAGELDEDDLRLVYEVFGASSPQIADFAEGWLEAYPKSSYAHVGLAWVYHRTGWNLRGDKLARKTYPAALDAFQSLHERAWEHAWAAYENDPDFAPATDALMRLANSTGRKMQAYEVLYEVMLRKPEMGILRRALDMTIPGWGGSWEQAEELCDYYAPMIKWKSSDPLLFCKVYAVLTYHGEPNFDWAIKALESGALPELDHLRASFAVSHSATRADAVFAYEYLTREGVTDYDTARKFDERVAAKYGYPFLSEDHLRRAKAYAAKTLERDPHNIAANKLMKKWISRFERKGDRYNIVVVERTSLEDELEYARNILLAAPFSAENWQDYGRLIAHQQGKRGFVAADPYTINAIVFSNHSPSWLLGYASNKWEMLARLERLETEPESEMWQSLNEEQRAWAEEDRQDWLKLRAQINLDDTLRCPMMRAYRLHGVLCEFVKDSDCSIEGQQQAMFELVRADVTKRRVCSGVMSATPEELFYYPQEVDLEQSGG